MELSVREAMKKDFHQFVEFQKKVYAGDPHFRDLQSLSLRNLLNKRAKILTGSKFIPYMVFQGDQLVGVFALVRMDRMIDTLQITFLDFLDDEAIFKTIHAFAKCEAKKCGVSKLLVGLNMHVNYGLGLLSDGFDKNQGFGVAYNKEYYILHIEKCMRASDILYSYRTRIREMNFPLSPKALDFIRKNFKVKPADFKNVHQVAKIYTGINNRAFVHHKYYYEAREEEDLELFRSFRFLIQGKNLLFVYHREEPVGFMLWYPDYNQVLRPGESMNLRSILKMKFFSSRIDTAKIVEFGIVPKFQNSGAVIALLDYLYRSEKEHYKYLESGWVMEENKASTDIARRYLPEVYKQFRVYEEVIS